MSHESPTDRRDTPAPSLGHLGIVGASPEGTAVFYRQISRQASRHLPPNEHPRLTVHNEPLSLYIDAIRKDDWHAVGRLLRKSAEHLARCGAQLVMCPDNVVQHAVQLAEVGSPVPWLTMPELVAKTIAAQGIKSVGLIGIRMVAQSSTYQTHLGLHGVKVYAPEASETDLLDQIIFGELIYGHIRPESRHAVLNMIAGFAERGCGAVVLASSEAPLLISAENSPLPVFDAADILAETAIRRVTALTAAAAGVSERPQG